MRLSVRLQISKHLFTSQLWLVLYEERNRFSHGPPARLVAHGLSTSATAAVAVHKSEVLKRNQIRWRYGWKAVPGTPNGSSFASFLYSVPHPCWLWSIIKCCLMHMSPLDSCYTFEDLFFCDVILLQTWLKWYKDLTYPLLGDHSQGGCSV